MYVCGECLLIPVKDEQEALELIARFGRKTCSICCGEYT
jgi:hypothetical protein